MAALFGGIGESLLFEAKGVPFGGSLTQPVTKAVMTSAITVIAAPLLRFLLSSTFSPSRPPTQKEIHDY
jgi:hypothetical protein